ncbi:MAG TPA: CDP-glycerol glycerophosphotransferase family protein [Galbitalea sp.]|nr:CDP-glycerol glycerophosphotransferase family protein [Galbitalea sp.]
MIRRILLIAAALVAAISTVTHWSLMLVAVALYVATVLMAGRSRVIRRSGDADQTGAAIVLSVATGIVVMHAGADTASVFLVAILLAVLHGLHLLRHVLRVVVYRRWRTTADWRNLTVAAPVPRRVVRVAGPTLVPIPVWIFAPICAVYDADPVVYVLLGILCLALVVVTFVPIADALLGNLRMPTEQQRLDSLTASLRELKPEILVHFNARTASAYALNEWMSTLGRVNAMHRVVILTVDREPWHFETITGSELPIVHLNGAEAIEYFVERVPSFVLALYPRNTSPNKNLLRVPGLYDVFINHGESDKPEAANPATRAFDEIWIAGEAARARYLDANLGVREEQLRITGRPQLSDLLGLVATTPRANATKSVVYAPTWEGYYAEDGYGSVITMGDRVLTALLNRGDLAVTYAPHPALGSLSRQVAEASDRIVARLKRAGGHSVLEGSAQERYAALAAADVLVADIGSDLVDYLSLGRPYVALNPNESETTAEFVKTNPSASAGIVVSVASIDTLDDAITRALGSDDLVVERSALANRYLGDLATPAIDRFLAEVDACLAHIHDSRPARELPAPAEEVAE